MSTICVVKKDGYVAIAADSRGKSGELETRDTYIANHEKIFQIGNNFIAICGHAALNLALQDYFHSLKIEPSFQNVSTIFRFWVELQCHLNEKYNMAEDENDILIANPYGIFGITDNYSVHEYNRFHSFGSGDHFALGAMYVAYQYPARTAEDVARIGVESGCEFATVSGPPIYSYSIKLLAPDTNT